MARVFLPAPLRALARHSAAGVPHRFDATAIAKKTPAFLVSVRTESEFRDGHPERAVNIPYMFRTGSGTTKNTHFLEQVSKIFGKDDDIIVGCQSGRRSLMAATELCAAGFTAVTDIAGGFSSWRDNGLPINQ
ncbi:unnamed protein product [Urochloa humidicola]